jgi:phosphate-selective porin OprO/OprP
MWSAVFLAGFAARAIAGTGDGDEKTPPAPAPTLSDSDRIKKLEVELEKLKAESEARQAGLPTTMSLEGQDKPKAEMDFRVSFTDGFHLKSSDGNFDLHIGGRVETDYRQVFDRPPVGVQSAGGGNSRLQPNTFFWRELFLSVDGTLYKDWGFKINGDFSQQAANSTNPTGQAAGLPENAWLEWKHWNEFRIQAGQFKSPNEAETMQSPLFTELINRSPMSRYVENFDLGAQVYGSIADSLFTYQLAVQNGRQHLANSGRALVDDNDGKEGAGRITLAPFVGQKDLPFLSGLRVGAWGSIGYEGMSRSNIQTTGGFPPGAGFASTAFNTGYLIVPGTNIFNGRRVREGAELTYTVYGLQIRGEVMQRRDEFVNLTTAPFFNGTLPMKGYYGVISYIVTGEDKIPDARITPRHNFAPWDGGWGAVELAARWSTVSLQRDELTKMGVNFAPPSALSAASSANRMDEIAVGVNWWFTSNVKLAFDYFAEHYNDTIGFANATGPVYARRNLNGVLVQFQIDF